MRDLLTSYYERNFDILVRMMAGRVDGVENAEDVVQEAFTRSLVYVDSYDPDRGEISTWFNKILRRAMFDFRRDQIRKGMTEEKLEADSDDCYTLKDLEIATSGELDREIEKRPENHAEVLRLHLVYGYPRRAIVEVTGQSPSNVANILFRFKTDMEKKYART